ncbi:MAG TPA: hypothetical protein VLG69_05135 [Candidatus Andersenbacteria bacterium]|nr:hypothetical protein [Candidatus Andersenbacteria bacterium]
MSIFKPQKIKDPRTGKERIISPEEQELMLMKGALFRYEIIESDSEEKTDEQNSPSQ